MNNLAIVITNEDTRRATLVFVPESMLLCTLTDRKHQLERSYPTLSGAFWNAYEEANGGTFATSEV